MKRILIPLLAAIVLGLMVYLLRPDPNPVEPIKSEKTSSPAKRANPPAEEEEEPPERRVPAVDHKTLLLSIAEAVRNGDKEAFAKLLDQLGLLVIPPEIPDEDNAALLYMEARGHLKMSMVDRNLYEVLNRFHGPLSPEDKTLLRGWLDQNARTIELLLQGAAKPACRYPVEYDKGFSAIPPSILRMEDMAQLLLVDARLNQSGSSVAAALTLARSVGDVPIMISQMTRMGMDFMVLGHLHDSLDPQNQEVVRFLENLDPAALRRRNQEALMMDVYRYLRTVEAGDPDGQLSQEKDFMKDPLRPQDVAYFVETMADAIEISGKPYRDVEKEITMLEEYRVKHAPWFAESTRTMMAGTKTMLLSVAVHESHLALARTALLVERRKQMDGSYPRFMEGLPTDPLSGKAFEYAREGEGYVLRSPWIGKRPPTWKRK